MTKLYNEGDVVSVRALAEALNVLHGMVESVCVEFKGFLPDIDDPSPRGKSISKAVNVADIKTRQLRIEDYISKADRVLKQASASLQQQPAPATQVGMSEEKIGGPDD